MSGAIPPLPQYAFIAWWLVKHRNNFTFYGPKSHLATVFSVVGDIFRSKSSDLFLDRVVVQVPRPTQLGCLCVPHPPSGILTPTVPEEGPFSHGSFALRLVTTRM